LSALRERAITKIPFMVKGKEGREKGKTASPNKGSEGFTLPHSPFSLPL
jgi:hypothetical protein